MINASASVFISRAVSRRPGCDTQEGSRSGAAQNAAIVSARAIGGARNIDKATAGILFIVTFSISATAI
jgi:hypothetical protein